ncbi:Type III chaperone protein ShcF, partial [Pseudomonas amygdali pv. photiniae]
CSASLTSCPGSVDHYNATLNPAEKYGPPGILVCRYGTKPIISTTHIICVIYEWEKHMKTNFDRWVDALIARYKLPTPPGKQFEDEVYRFMVNDDIPVKIYGERDGCIYLHSTLGAYQDKYEGFSRELLQANDFSLKKPCLILGLDNQYNLILHARLLPADIEGAQGIASFEHFIDSSSAIKNHFNLKEGLK